MENQEEIKPKYVREHTEPADTHMTIEVTKNDVIYRAFVKDIPKRTLSMALSKMRNVSNDNFDMFEVGEMILRDTFIGGDIEILEDTKMLLSASLVAMEQIEMYDVNVKKN
jgi:hypothetical protein